MTQALPNVYCPCSFAHPAHDSCDGRPFDVRIDALRQSALAFKERAEQLGVELTDHELERIERLKKRARYLQNKIDERPRYEMGHSKAELSSLKWAIERITGQSLLFVDAAIDAALDAHKGTGL